MFPVVILMVTILVI